MFIWQIDQIYGGDMQKIIQRGKELGYTGVVIKFANGSLSGDQNSQHYMNQFRNVAPQFKKAGFVVGGWIYQYLTDVAGEVDACSQAIDAGAEWIVLDGEVEIANQHSRVAEFGRLFRQKHPDVAVGFSSFPITSLHTDIPYQEYAAFCNVMMPQIYWALMGWSLTDAFGTTVKQYQQFNLPLAPTGQAFGKATTDEIKQFIKLCVDAGIKGVSWWSWQHATEQQLDATSTTAFQPPVVDPPVNGGVTTPTVKDYPDVAKDRWSYEAIMQVTAAGIMRGYEDGTFRPQQPTTREEVAMAMSKLLDIIKNHG